METEETIEDMMENYNIALNDVMGKRDLLDKLLRDYQGKKVQVWANQDAIQFDVFPLLRNPLNWSHDSKSKLTNQFVIMNFCV